MEPTTQEEILSQLRLTNEHLARNLAYQRSWWLPLRNGVLVGLGTVVGATILVSLIVSLVRPFEKITPLGPQLERIARDLESHRK